MLVFVEGGKPEDPEKNPWSKDANQQQTKPGTRTVYCFQVELQFGMLVFVEGGKPEDPEKNPWSKDANQQQTKPTCDARSGNRTWTTVMGGGRSCAQRKQKSTFFGSGGKWPLSKNTLCVYNF